MRFRGSPLLGTLALIFVLCLSAVWPSWAMPGQSALRQTVPTRVPTATDTQTPGEGPVRPQGTPLPALPPQITSPAENAVVRGIVPIMGTAVGPEWWKYEVHWGPEPDPVEQWAPIGVVHEEPVIDGLLETWDTAAISDGTYILRLRIVNITGNYLDIFVRGIVVANAQPLETPTLAEQPSPTAKPTDTSPPAAATPVPTTDTPEPPTATPVPPTNTPMPPTATPPPPAATPTATPGPAAGALGSASAIGILVAAAAALSVIYLLFVRKRQ